MLQSKFFKFLMVYFIKKNFIYHIINQYNYRSIEQATLICKEMGNLTEVSKLAHSACSLYLMHGSPESGATVLDKGGKMIEATQPQEALDLFKRAASIVMVIFVIYF